QLSLILVHDGVFSFFISYEIFNVKRFVCLTLLLGSTLLCAESIDTKLWLSWLGLEPNSWYLLKCLRRSGLKCTKVHFHRSSHSRFESLTILVYMSAVH
uniref:Secreted protein n=1 Tax=Mesocestoides corti TaxID=53468 RepID=A0A5K3FS10_MESCO